MNNVMLYGAPSPDMTDPWYKPVGEDATPTGPIQVPQPIGNRDAVGQASLEIAQAGGRRVTTYPLDRIVAAMIRIAPRFLGAREQYSAFLAFHRWLHESGHMLHLAGWQWRPSLAISEHIEALPDEASDVNELYALAIGAAAAEALGHASYARAFSLGAASQMRVSLNPERIVARVERMLASPRVRIQGKRIAEIATARVARDAVSLRTLSV